MATFGSSRLKMGQPMYGVKITGVGAGIAPYTITNDDLAASLDTSDEWIYTRTGIKERRIVGGDTTMGELAIRASQEAIASAGYTVQDIDFIIAATSTPDILFPALSGQIQAGLQAPHLSGFDLALACTGFVAAMTTAEQFIRTGMHRRILVVGADVLSRFMNWEDRTTCILFGDGAGAVIMEAVMPEDTSEEDTFYARRLHLDGIHGEQLCLKFNHANAPFVPPKTPVNPHLTMNGKEVYKFATRVAPQAVQAVLEESGLTVDALDWLILHQANIRIMQVMSEQLGIPQEKMVINLDRYGNTSAASIPLALHEAVTDGRIQPGHLIATCGFGGGLSWGASLFRWQGKVSS